MNSEVDSSHRQRVGWPELLIIIAVALELAVALGAHYFPYSDPTDHLARYALMARIWFGDPPGYVVMRWVPTPYIAGDVIGALSVHFIGPVATLRLFNFVKLILLPLGMYALLCEVAPQQRGWALVGVLFGFISQYLFGYMNFSLGVGLVFCWLALWYPRRTTTSWGTRLLLALGGVVLFLVHLSAPLMALVVVWTDWGLAAIGEDVIQPPSRWRLINRQLPVVLTVTVGIALVWAASTMSLPHEVGPPGEYFFRPFTNKLIAFTSPFYSVSLLAACVMMAGYLASVATMLYLRRDGFRFDTFTVSAVVMFVLYLLFPRETPGTDAVDIRWLAAGYPLLFCGGVRGVQRVPRLALLVPFLACVVHTGAIAWSARQIDQDLDRFTVALSHVPARTNLLALGDGIRMFGRVQPEYHFALWHTITGHGRAPGLFNYRNASDQDPLYFYWAHFIEPTHLFMADSKWGEGDRVTGLPWPRIDREYDYILQVQSGDRVRAYLRNHADEVWHDEPFILYKVRKQQQ